MDAFVLTVGQLVLYTPEQVYDQIQTTMVEHPETELFVYPEFATQHAVDLDAVAYLSADPEARATAEGWLKLVPEFSRVRALADEREADWVLIDGSPGIGCPVHAAVNTAERLLAVTEPSVSGHHDPGVLPHVPPSELAVEAAAEQAGVGAVPVHGPDLVVPLEGDPAPVRSVRRYLLPGDCPR